MPFEPGARLGPYEVLSAVGAGGMGEVYRCRDTRLSRVVAIKVLPPSLAADPDFRKRFAREANIIAQLEHPNICTLYDVGDHNGTAFLVMPLLEGESLADRLSNGPLPISEGLAIVVGVASALSYAHERGVLHRDVKPRNIMLCRDGVVKLVDFGVAKSYHPDLETTAETALTTGGVVGTLEYMSPEQLGGRALDARTDVFSLGVVLYELITGCHPFRAATNALTARAILDGRYTPLPPRDPLMRRLDGVLARALAPDPASRYTTMPEFLGDLRIAQASAGDLEKRSQSPPLRWIRGKSAVALGVGALALVTLAVAFGPAGRPNGGAPGPTPQPPATPVERNPQLANYRPVTAGGSIAGNVDELGVTVWRMRAARDGDQARLLVHEVGSDAVEWTPERVELGAPLAIGDRVRITVESPRAGYLYVIDRERYADGTTGEATLIFPTLHTRAGDNRVANGRLIDIPSQSDRPPYFTLRRGRPDQTAELLTLIVSVQPVAELMPGDRPVRLTPAMVARLEERGASKQMERLEMIDGAGRAWSLAEQQAGADATRVLSHEDPGPQTLFRVVTNEPGFLVAQVTLAHERKE